MSLADLIEERLLAGLEASVPPIDAMTRAYGVALVATPAGSRWRRLVGRRPIGRLEVERMLRGHSLPELNWCGFPERMTVYGVAVLDPSGWLICTFGVGYSMDVEPMAQLRWAFS